MSPLTSPPTSPILQRPALRCPVCKEPLALLSNGVRCLNGHHFDRARQGYLNLLPVHKKRSVNPGDNSEMVRARSRFLDGEFYQAPATALLQQAAVCLGRKAAPVVVDAGCGEGYYTLKLRQQFPQATVCGFDISRPAIQHCCHRSKALDLANNSEWLVASVADIPLLDNSADLIVSVFSRVNWSEFDRILKPGGHLLVLNPGPEHLWELREQIYSEVRPYPEDKLLNQLPETFALTNNTIVQDQLALPNSATILDLLAMTPHYWHIKPEPREQLNKLKQLQCRLDMRLFNFIKRSLQD